MKFVEVSGKTVEDAVKAGLKELNKSSSEVTIDVVDYGSPGLFGMFGRLAKVKLTVREEDPAIDFEMPVFSLDQQAAKPQKPKPEPKKAPEPQRAKPEPQAEQRKPEAKPEPKPEMKTEAQKIDSKPEALKPQAPKPEARREALKPRPPKPRAQQRPEPVLPEGEAAAPRRKPRPPRKPEENRRPADVQPMQPMTMEVFPPIDPDALSGDAKIAYDFLRELTGLMGVEVEIRMKETQGHLSVQMTGDTLGILIGRRGETLDALQYLTSLQVNKGREDYLRVTLDTEHYRAKREEALIRLAERMANRARKTGHRVALEPMNPYERRVLHSALQNNPYVTTHSEGDEPYRRVIITLK